MPAGLIAAVGGTAAASGLAGAAVTAGTAIAGAVGGSGAQSSDISQGQQQSIAAVQNGYNEYDANEQPYISTGQNALSAVGDAAGLNGATGYANALSNFQASPGYQYDLAQGLSAVDNGAASLGTLRSGNTIRAEETLGSNLANQDFNQYYTRLNGLATLGQGATTALGGAGITVGSNIASTDASAATAQAKIDGTTSSNVGNALGSLANSKSVQSALTGALTPSTTNPSAPAITAQSGTTGVGVGAGSGGLY